MLVLSFVKGCPFHRIKAGFIAQYVRLLGKYSELNETYFRCWLRDYNGLWSALLFKVW